MLNILSFLLNLIDQHVILLYAFCLILILFNLRAYVLARRDRFNTIFTIEKEVAAHKEGRAMSAIGVALGIAAIVTTLKYYVVPSIDVTGLAEPTPTLTLRIPTNQPTPTPTEEPPTPTPRPRPTRRPVATAVPPTATPVPPAPCPDPNTRITSPGMGETVAGRIVIQGTALQGRFQFYKVEFGQGEEPTSWHSIHDIHRTPVDNGLLEEFDTTLVPNGVYWLKLTVVDETSNFPPPCRVRIVVQN